MNYYISDTHFGHKNILRFDRRPFADIEQMETSMVTLWNAAVKNSDTVYILGDFCWGKSDEWIRILRQLKGSKVLIEGNHDLKQYPPEIKRLFADIKPYKEVVDYSREGDVRKVCLCHYPMMFYKRANNEQYYMLCGHVHSTNENRLLEKWTAELCNGYRDNERDHAANAGQIYNVGCMMPWMEYTPRTLDEIIERKNQYVIVEN